MIIRLLALCAIILTFGNYSPAQIKDFQPRLNHPIKFGKENSSSVKKDYYSGTDSVKVVAILVQFQEDNDNRSTGNGLFDLSNTYYNPSLERDTVIDAPPYDSAYFADHLIFLQNYYRKASKGKLNISFDLYGTVINLPNQMQAYSPQRNESNAKLGDLFTDSWTRADQFIDFSQYQNQRVAYVIFHAGVGRDVDLTSIYGFDPTPYDIPSVYLGLNNLREFYGNNYNGIQTSDGVFIQNSLIIPSTELRTLDLLSGTALLELGINGILTASFGSYLGLPDLFNTATGRTAIGRFGLMDGQSLFSYNGIFPPEPSAWEKIYLGWVDPVTVSSGSRTVNLPTSSKSFARDTSIYKVLINSREYFLIENRNRDPENDGQTITSRNRAFLDSETFVYDDVNGFYYNAGYSSLWKLNGNVRDVQTFDWSLPGLIDTDDNYKGGILIWHIDENVIDANIASNTINNNIDHKGVDLEEAKGAQEIGLTFSTVFGNITGDGTIVDYWFDGYHGVPSNIYINEFTPNSIPNSLSYTLSNNNIFITDFSTIDTVMSFNLRIGSTTLLPIDGFPKNIGLDTNVISQAIAFDFIGDGSDEIFANGPSGIFGFASDGSPLTVNGLIVGVYGQFIPAIYDRDTKLIVGIRGNTITFVDQNYSSNNVVLPGNSPVSAAPIVFNQDGLINIGRDNGSIYKLSNTVAPERIDSSSGPVNQLAASRTGALGTVSSGTIYGAYGSLLDRNGNDFLTISNTGEFFINGNRLNISYSLGQIQSPPSLADLDSDGRQEIIFVASGKVYALNSSGVLIDNFPANVNANIVSGISVCDLNNDNKYDLIFVSDEGDMYAYSADGTVISGFPVKVGPSTTSTPALANLDGKLGIIIAGGDGYLYGFKTNIDYASADVLWKNYLSDGFLSNNNFRTGSNQVSYSEKLPSDKVYNWPNPVYDSDTFIRYYLNGSASSVTIRIVDLSGELVTSLTGTTFSNADNEVRWDVSDVQSGIYYALVKADIDGSTEEKIIKIAVVK